MKYDTMKLTVGLFVIALFLILFGFLFVLLKDKGVFEQRYTYHFKTFSADYFYVGMPLKLSGFKVGTIDKISLEDNGKVHMEFSVIQKNRKWVSQGSVLMIIKPLIGSAHIELFTSLDSPILEEGAQLRIISSDSINELVMKLQPIVKKSLNILDSVNTITTYLASEDSELREILRNLNKFSAKLANDDSLLTSVTGDANSAKAMVDSLNQTAVILKDVREITKEISKITASLNTSIVEPTSSSIHEAEAILKDIKQKLDTLDGTVKTIGTYDKDLTQLKDQISVGIQKSNQIIDKVDAVMSEDSSTEVKLP